MIVVDTNVLAYLLLPGGSGAVAEQVLARDPRWAAPLLLALRVPKRARRVGPARARSLWTGRSPPPSMPRTYVRGREYIASPARDVLELAERSGCTAYDCEFVALAQELGVRLVTSDRQVLAAFPETAVSPEAFVAH